MMMTPTCAPPGGRTGSERPSCHVHSSPSHSRDARPTMSDRIDRRAAPTELPPVSRYPLHPFLFAAYAVLFLYSENLADVLLVDIGKPLTTALLQAIVAFAVASIL